MREFDWNDDKQWGESLYQDLLLNAQMFNEVHYPLARERIAKGISPPSLLQEKQDFHERRIREITADWQSRIKN